MKYFFFSLALVAMTTGANAQRWKDTGRTRCATTSRDNCHVEKEQKSGSLFWVKYQWISAGDDCDACPIIPEICDGVDNDLDGQIDEGLPLFTFYRDSDADGFGDLGKRITSCSLPSGYVSDSSDCDDADARLHTALTYFADRNGDGYGDSPNDIVFACSVTPPANASAVLAPLADFTAMNTGRALTPDFWIFNTENLFYDKDTRVFYDPLVGSLHERILSLAPRGFMYSGSASHYHRYLASDSVIYAPTGYNAIATTNEMTPTGITWRQSHLATTIELARQLGGGLLLQSSPVEDCDNFLAVVNRMTSKGVPLLGLLVDQEYSDATWANCTNCGNGDAVAADGSFWFGCASAFSSLPFIIDNAAQPLAPVKPTNYAGKIRNTVGYNSQRFYFSPSKAVPNLTASMNISQLADSLDFAVDVKLPQLARACSRSAFITSLYPEDVFPRVGRLASFGTWLNSYFVARSYAAALTEPTIKGVVFGRFDLLDVKLASTNSLFDCMLVISEFFNTSGTIYSVSASGLSAVVVADSSHHGAALIINRTAARAALQFVSLDGYVVAFDSGFAQVATGLGDTAPALRSVSQIEPYSITVARF